MTTDDTLIFPLNVYSALMQLYAGRVPFLSYGGLSQSDIQALSGPVSDKPASGNAARLASMLIESQWRRADQLLGSILSAAEARQHNKPHDAYVVKTDPYALRVLEVGCGSGELARLLAGRGFDVCAIDISAAAIPADPFPEVSSGSLQFIVCDFEKFEDQRGFDLLICNNSARYFMPLTLFYKAQSLLRPGGQMLICEEFASNRGAEPQPDTLPVLNHVLALAQRLGFDQSFVDDLTEETVRFQQAFIQLFGGALSELPALTGLTGTEIDNLYQALQADKLAAEQGRRCHALLSLTAAAEHGESRRPDTVYLRSAADLEPVAFKQVFERSFDVDFFPELWAWKYHGGRGASVVAERDGIAIAHYGGVVRDIHYFSRPCRAVQICDVMVMPDERSFFSRNGLFFKTAASMLEQYVGYRADNLLGFGFPNIKAMHVAERLGLYEKTDELMQIALAPANANALPAGWALEVAGFDPLAANQLWPAMLQGFPDAIIGVRDAEYLHYRYLQRPGQAYECLRLVCHGELKAMAFRRPHYDGYLVMDIIAATQDLPAAIQSVLQPAVTGGPSVFWLTAGQLPRVRYNTDNLLITDTGIQIPCNRWSRGPATSTLAGKWWLTAGDMDFL